MDDGGAGGQGRGGFIYFFPRSDRVRGNDTVRSDSEVLNMRWLDAVLSTTARAGAANSMAAPAAAGYGGVYDKCFWAFMLYYSGESSYAPLLRLPLLEAAIKLRKRNRWKRIYANKPWTDRLVSLALREYSNPTVAHLNGWWRGYDDSGGPVYAAWKAGDEYEFVEGWWSADIDCPAEAWSRMFSPRYESLRAILDGWRDTGKRIVSNQLQFDYQENYSGQEKAYKESRSWGGEGHRAPAPDSDNDTRKKSDFDREMESYLMGKSSDPT